MGIGVIARNANEDIIACLCSTIEAAVKPVMAEALALSRAMVYSHELGLSNVILGGD